LHVFAELVRIFPKPSIDPVDRNGLGVLETAYRHSIADATAVLDLADDRLTRKDVSLTLLRAVRQWMWENSELLKSTEKDVPDSYFGTHRPLVDGRGFRFNPAAMSNFIQKLLARSTEQVAIEVRRDGKTDTVIGILQKRRVSLLGTLKKNCPVLDAHDRIVTAVKQHQINRNPPLMLDPAGR
jgi:hypothetical protein